MFNISGMGLQLNYQLYNTYDYIIIYDTYIHIWVLSENSIVTPLINHHLLPFYIGIVGVYQLHPGTAPYFQTPSIHSRGTCSSRCCKSLALSKRACPRHRAPTVDGGIFQKKDVEKCATRMGNPWFVPCVSRVLNFWASLGGILYQEKRQIHLKRLELCCCLLEWELNTLLSNICCVFQSCLSPAV